MRERESGNNFLDAQYSFKKNASEVEVLAMHINGAEPYRKKKAITKIFRRSKYIPKLEDIEENPEIEGESFISLDKSHDLSLSFIHLERALSAGVMAQDSWRPKRKASSRSENAENAILRREHRRRRRSSALKE